MTDQPNHLKGDDVKKKRDVKLGLQAERIRELTSDKLPMVIGGLMNDGAGGGGGTESANCPPPTSR